MRVDGVPSRGGIEGGIEITQSIAGPGEMEGGFEPDAGRQVLAIEDSFEISAGGFEFTVEQQDLRELQIGERGGGGMGRKDRDHVPGFREAVGPDEKFRMPQGHLAGLRVTGGQLDPFNGFDSGVESGRREACPGPSEAKVGAGRGQGQLVVDRIDEPNGILAQLGEAKVQGNHRWIVGMQAFVRGEHHVGRDVSSLIEQSPDVGERRSIKIDVGGGWRLRG